jgi:putative transposon-encoded protein
MKKTKKIKKKNIILKGEGANQHTLYGKFKMEDNHDFFSEISVLEDSELRHEQPNGQFAEHNTLKIKKGEWVLGKQVEYNPFKRSISQIWD